MSGSSNYLAFDLGAESGRAILGIVAQTGWRWKNSTGSPMNQLSITASCTGMWPDFGKKCSRTVNRRFALD